MFRTRRHRAGHWLSAGRIGLRAAGLASTAILALGVGSCSMFHRAYETIDFSLTLTNGLPEAVNVYARPSSDRRRSFLGQVGPGRTDTLVVRRVPIRDVIQLRASTITGERELGRDVEASDRSGTWRLP
jgi:hypothetical protein